jgi:hypothetical protein
MNREHVGSPPGVVRAGRGWSSRAVYADRLVADSAAIVATG